MPNQPSKTEDRPGIQDDSKGCFVYIQGDLDNIPPANLSCWNSGHTWPTELWYFSGLEACRASGGFSKRKRQEIWAAEHTAGPGSLSWISERLIILDWGESGIEGWKGVNRGSRQSVHQRCCGAFRHITAGTNGDQGLEWDHMTHKSRHHPVSLYRWWRCHTEGKIEALRNELFFVLLFLSFCPNQLIWNIHEVLKGQFTPKSKTHILHTYITLICHYAGAENEMVAII